MAYGILHRGFSNKTMCSWYCAKCDKDTPHRGHPSRCIYCQSVPNEPGKAANIASGRKIAASAISRGIDSRVAHGIRYGGRQKRINTDKREYLKRKAAEARAKWETKEKP